MEEYKEQKHMCKFCSKSFPCGRSLGGHMRSHLITIASSDHHHKTGPKKKLPPLVNGGQYGYGLRENPKKTNKSLKSSEEDTLLQEKLCKECGKSFQSWKALFGHMKCHSVNARIANSVEEDSWNSSNDHHKLIMDSQSDNEAATPLCRRKRSDRMKRYTATTNSSSLTNANFSSSVSDHSSEQEQEEVALSLIILSRDKGDWGGIDSAFDYSDHSSEFLEANKVAKSLVKDSKECLKFKKLRNNGKLEPTILNSDELKILPIPRNGLKTRTLEVSADGFREDDKSVKNNPTNIGCNESEVNSPKNLIKGSGFSQFETESKKNKPRKRKCIDAHDPSESEICQDFEKKSKFTCSICKRAFLSYQALGGHRASHKKFKGCCAPKSEDSLETENSHNQSRNNTKIIKCSSRENLISTISAAKAGQEAGWKKNKEHECPICFKVFPSGQALGGHKRSHLICDQAKTNPANESHKPIRETQNFLDLNLPAPAEEECNDFKFWWIGISHQDRL